MLSKVHSGAVIGIESIPILVEVNTGLPGEPRFITVGLPDAAVKESQDRVGSALMNNGFLMPKTRTVVNLSPGNLRKEGPIYDLPIALGVIKSTGQANLPNLDDFIIAGELSLSGELLPIAGCIALAMQARKYHKKLILPRISAETAAFVNDIEIFAANVLHEVVQFLSQEIALPKMDIKVTTDGEQNFFDVDFSEVKGQKALRRAVEVAVAGGHNLLMVGTPGSGKSMIAKRIPTIMPTPTLEEFLEILSVYSSCQRVNSIHEVKRPFRAPHHTISDVGLLGGGSYPVPGEISLAHNGVLFLDELPEFRRSTLEVLRQPLEDGFIAISRSAAKVQFPCSFMLIAAMNPCPCGFLGDSKRECLCSPGQIQRYRSKISGPLLDRIDLHVDVRPIDTAELRYQHLAESSAAMRERVIATREVQKLRNRSNNFTNAKMNHGDLRKYCSLNSACELLLTSAINTLALSARAHDRILKVARTIADLEGVEDISEPHLLEAIHYRSLDRRLF
ncbi:MAG: YifB family Mg chelatase-like AAA ATPase [Puniceicoccales bacterium]|jgi:magnesium chelatase family protein|nr:YifB family Mg chelatase-like AAA ATPase [Puniceicoccales bacterium]